MASITERPTAKMKACEINPIAADGKIRIVERPVPEPGIGEVLIRVRAASLNYRDLLVARNFYRSTSDRLIPLSDGTGDVVALGPGVDAVRLGQRVAGAFFPDWTSGPLTAANRARSLGANMDGMLAEFALLPVHAAIPIPDHLNYEEAATLPCAALTAWNAVAEVANVRPGMTVLLQGSGGVSVMALQFAKLTGARVIHTSSDAAKRARLVELGADVVIDHRAEPDWHRKVLDLTFGEGVDVVLDIGGPGTLAKSLRAVRIGGTIVSIGFVAKGEGIDPGPLISRAIRLIGITVGSCDMFRAMNRAISQNGMRPVVDRVLPMEEAGAGYRLLEAGGHFGKIAISIGSGANITGERSGAMSTPD